MSDLIKAYTIEQIVETSRKNGDQYIQVAAPKWSGKTRGALRQYINASNYDVRAFDLSLFFNMDYSHFFEENLRQVGVPGILIMDNIEYSKEDPTLISDALRRSTYEQYMALRPGGMMIQVFRNFLIPGTEPVSPNRYYLKTPLDPQTFKSRIYNRLDQYAWDLYCADQDDQTVIQGVFERFIKFVGTNTCQLGELGASAVHFEKSNLPERFILYAGYFDDVPRGAPVILNYCLQNGYLIAEPSGERALLRQDGSEYNLEAEVYLHPLVKAAFSL